MSNFAVMPLIDYQNTCDAIREKTGTTDLVKSGEMAEKIKSISGENGINYDLFWDTFQNKGNRVNYQYGFSFIWNDAIYNPKYPITCVGTGAYIATSLFAGAGITDTKVPIIINGTRADSVFQDCEALKKIPSITFENIVRFSNTFRNCKALEEMNVYGTIDVGGLDVSASTKLTRESLLSIANALKDFSTENTIINDLTLTHQTPSILCEYTLTPGKTYITSFSDISENGESGEFVPTYNDFSAVAENINVYGVGEKLGVHYIVDVWAAPDDYTFNLVIYQEGNQLKELRYLENKHTGEISLNGQAGDRICVKVKADSSYAITLGATNLNKLTEQEKAVAIKKGWILQ